MNLFRGQTLGRYKGWGVHAITFGRFSPNGTIGRDNRCCNKWLVVSRYVFSRRSKL